MTTLLRHTTSVFFVLALLAGVLVLSSCARSQQPADLEDIARGIDKQLICPVCPGETINQSQTELAKQMRDVVREKVAAGESKEQVLQFFVDKYGTSVLAEPPRSGFNLVAWVVPPAAILSGLIALYLVLRAMSRKPSEAPRAAVERASAEGLRPYLEQVDRELEQSTGTSRSPKETVFSKGEEKSNE